MSKRGRLSKVETDCIVSNWGTLSPEEIAKKLNRTVETVKEYGKVHVKTVAPTADTEKAIIRHELRNSHRWKRLKDELMPDEVAMFEEEYLKLMAQFKGDVLPSEENQIFDAIKFDLLKSRNMVERRRAREDISKLEEIQVDFISQFGGDPKKMSEDDKEYAVNLETQLNAARSAEQSRTTEFVKLQERLDKLMQSLKAVRDQRIKQVADSKVSFVGVIKMLQERDVQAREGRQMELMKLAGAREYQRLGQGTTYEDGTIDSPILSADTVGLEASPTEEESTAPEDE